MATKIVMEALSPTMEEGRLVEWKKQVGDRVAVGDVLAEVETDKAVMELVARHEGTLLEQVAGAGATLAVASLVGWIGEPGEAIPGGGAPAPTAAPAAPAAPAPTASPAPAPAPVAPTSPAPAPAAAPGAGGRIKASPLARRMAAEKGLDLSRVAGSGPEGRIVRRDIEGASSHALVPMAPEVGGGYTDVALSQVRKTIAKRLSQSIGPIPTYYLTVEADMTRAREAREGLLRRDPDGKFSFNDLVIRAAASALREHPWVNAWWMDDAVRQWHEVHIGVAVAIEDGLITPVVRHADRKSLRAIATEVRELAGRAREKRLKPEEYTGSTFSISNLGMFGIDEFTAVINPPEAAILAVGRLEEKPVVVDGALAVRPRMRMTLSCDHRVIDGATGAAFLKTLVGMLENPLALVW